MLKPILLVEDNTNDLELTLFALEKCKLSNEIVVVRDGEEAIHYLMSKGKFSDRPEGNPALVLLDLKLPKMDGIDVLKKIRETDALKNIPVAMFTSSREPQDLDKSYALGLNSYVVKPIDFNHFMNAVMELGLFWTVHNEPPPGSVRLSRPA
jgi:CheY-like chemotaxis protein